MTGKDTMLFQRRKQLSKEEATRVAEAVLSIHTHNSPKITLLYDKTCEFDNYWRFIYNSVEYATTREIHKCAMGCPPIFVDKFTAQIRITTAMYADQQFDFDVEAGDREWCLNVRCNIFNRSAIVSKLATALGIALGEAVALLDLESGPVWVGPKAALDWLRTMLHRSGVPCKVGLCSREIADRLRWFDVDGPRGLSELHDVYSKSWKTSYRQWHPDPHYRYYECPIQDISEKLSGNPVRWMPRYSKSKQTPADADLFDRAVIEGREGYLLIQRLLVNKYVDADRRIPRLENDSALCHFIRLGDAEMVKMLLCYGADPLASDHSGRLPQELATALGFEEIAEVFRNWRVPHNASQ